MKNFILTAAAILILVPVGQANAQTRSSDPFYKLLKAVMCLPQYTKKDIEQQKLEVINSDDPLEQKAMLLEILDSCPTISESNSNLRNPSTQRR